MAVCSKAHPEVQYAVRPSGMSAGSIELSHNSDYRIGDVVPWVKVEKYLFGTVMDMGVVRARQMSIFGWRIPVS